MLFSCTLSARLPAGQRLGAGALHRAGGGGGAAEDDEEAEESQEEGGKVKPVGSLRFFVDVL